MYTHLKERKYYEDLYDRLTVDWGRRNLIYFEEFYQKWFEIMPDEKPDSFRSVFHLNHVYMTLVGYELLERYDKREEDILRMMERDEAQDEKIANARLTTEPICQHCQNVGLRITDKSLMSRKAGSDASEEVLFMLKCTKCDKNSAYWEDGSEWEHRVARCPKCSAVMKNKGITTKSAHITTYTCTSCKHSYKEKLDFTAKKEREDPDFEHDRKVFGLKDSKSLEEHRVAKRRYEGLAQLSKDLKEKEDNKHIYDAMKELKKPKIAELTPLLSGILENAGYIEFHLDKPDVGKDVYVGFSCLDSKPGREDYDSRKTLKKLVDNALRNTNWRLMSDGISYRLGYLNGRVRAFEREEDIKKLVIKTNRLKPKPETMVTSKNKYTVRGKNGEDIIL